MTSASTVVRWSIPIVWAIGMFAARHVDPTMAIAISASVMAVAVVATDRGLILRLLRPSVRSSALATLAAAAMLAVTYLLFPPLARWVPAIGSRSAAIYSLFLSGRAATVILLFVIPIVVAEEILWRGAFQETVRTEPAIASVLISATVYAAAHAPLGSALLVAVAFLCGLFWASLRVVSGSLVPSLASHLVWDLALIFVPLVPHGTRWPVSS